MKGMKMNISLATKRRWNWKVLLVLVGLVIPAALAQLAAQGLRLSGAILVTVGQNMVIYVLLPAAIGLLLGNRIGLGMPFVESWARHEPDSHRFRYVAALSVIAGIAVALLYQFMEFAVFRAPMNSMFAELGIRPVEEFFPSPLNGFLLGFGAGVLEEVLHRLFGLTLLAWLGGLLFHESDGRPKPAVLWVANLLIALEFAAGHVAAAFVLGWPADPLVIIRGMLFNTVAGMTFGWLFFTFGLESAMLGHFLADAVFYTLLPLASMPGSEMGRILATAGVSLVILLALAWGWRTLRRETRHVASAE
jgi:hypothetical protein